MNRASSLALAACVAVGAVSCGKTPPATPVATALVIPTPPARLLIPVELPEYVEPLPEPAIELAPPPEPATETTANRSTEKPPAPAPAPPANPPAPPVLQTTNAAPTALERRVRALLSQAEAKLKTVNFRELGTTAKAHHGQARDFIRMANDQLRTRNYTFAEQLAIKANTVAGLLTRN